MCEMMTDETMQRDMIRDVQSNTWQDRFFGYGLNFGTQGEQPDRFSRHIGLLRTAKCPECGTVFHYAKSDQWAYKIVVKKGKHPILYCRYNCMRAAERRQSKRRYRTMD